MVTYFGAGSRKEKMGNKRGYFLVVNYQNVFLEQTIMFKKIG